MVVTHHTLVQSYVIRNIDRCARLRLTLIMLFGDSRELTIDDFHSMVVILPDN